MTRESFELRYRQQISDIFFPNTGSHEVEVGGKNFTLVSENSWEEYVAKISKIENDEKIVISPEIITATGLGDRWSSDQIEKRIELMRKESRNKPDITYVTGTPIYKTGEDKPYNGAIVLKNGEVVGQVTKKTAVTDWEKEIFETDPEETPMLIPGTKIGILICSDLPMASAYLRYNGPINDRWLELSGNEHLQGKNIEFIDQTTETILVLACWGIGSRTVGVDPNIYYRQQMESIVFGLRDHPTVKNIIVADRQPEGMVGDMVPTIPFNAVFQMQDK